MFEGLPDWMVGSGLDTDMKGDYDPSRSIQRIWLKPGTSKKIIFLTDAGSAPVIWEHQVLVGGGWRNWFTCLQSLGQECDLCNWAEDNSGQFRRYKAAFFSVIDTDEYTDKQGKKHKNEKRLFVAKNKTVDLIKRRASKLKSDGKSLKYAIVEAYRTNEDKSPSVGDQFEFDSMTDPSALEDVTEFNYAEILNPDPVKVRNVFRRLLRERDKTGKDYPESWDTEKEGTEETVDFNK